MGMDSRVILDIHSSAKPHGHHIHIGIGGIEWEIKIQPYSRRFEDLDGQYHYCINCYLHYDIINVSCVVGPTLIL